MNIRDLTYIVAVSEARSFVRAAERCFISQPTLSTQIKKMEEELGVKLFERTNKKVLLTEVGEAIVLSAQTILGEVERMKQLAANARDPLAGELKLGAFPSLASYLFPSAVLTIKQALPKIKLILVEEKTNLLIEQLERGEIDAAFIALPAQNGSLVSSPLFDDVFRLAVSTNHPFANKKKISPYELENQQLLLLDDGHCLRDQALQFCQWSGAEEQLGVRASSLETLRQMVIAGTGVTLMPNIAINEKEEGIRYISFEKPVPKRTVGLVWRKSSVRYQLMERLIELFESNSYEFNER